MSRRVFLLGALIALLVFGASGAGAAATLTDPQGDAVGGAADITQVVVSNDLDGDITFAVTLPDRPTFTADDLLFIFLNTDKDAATGIPGGIDYAVVVDSNGGTLLRASGSSFAPAPQTTLTLADNGKTIRVNRSELGNTVGFLFAVASGLDSNESADDTAPDSGTAVYDLTLKPVLDSLVARFSPAKPKHGKPFRLAGTTLRLDDGTVVKGTTTCVAKLNGKRLAGRCSWRIPASARGKRLVVTLTARYQGVSATFTPWRFRVG
ncbi:MAG: hypothetical protein ACJ74R_03930 [Gaiellaceae bacterium]